MRIDIITVLPHLLSSPFENSIVKRARDKRVVEIHIHDLRDYSTNKHKKVDDYQFGGGAGMVLQIEPIFACISNLQKERSYDSIIYVTPDAPQYTQKAANALSLTQNIIIICGHYKGVDFRVREHIVTEEYSIGDFVITGGELAAAIIVDSVVRLLPGAMSDMSSALDDSFQDNLLAPPIYTRPEVFNGWEVPDILLSGNTKKIEQWRLEQSLDRTNKIRPDLCKE